jgi:hypothetical protein
MATASTSRRTAPPWVTVVVAGAVLLIAVLIVGPAAGPATGPPLDPDSSAPDGLLGLVRVLEELDVEVEVTAEPPPDTTTRAYLPVDVLPDDVRDEWDAWVAAGGTLVVTDAWSPLHDREFRGLGIGQGWVPEEHTADCPLVPDEVGQVVHNRWVGVPYESGEVACYVDDGEYAWLVEVEHGDGRLLVAGSSEPFVNAWLPEADNALLAATLLGPEPGGRLAFIPRDASGAVDVGLLDVLPDGVWRGLLLGLLALVVGVIARARRLGRPVEERLPRVLPSAELATSLAGLSRRAGDRSGAAARLRSRARASVARNLGMAADTPAEDLVQRFAATSRLEPDDIRMAFVDGPVDDDPALVAVADAVSRILHEIGVGPADTHAAPMEPVPATASDSATNLPPIRGE